MLARGRSNIDFLVDVGNPRIESSTIRSYAGISTAQSLSASDLNAAYQSIASSGLFEEVEIVPNGRVWLLKSKSFRPSIASLLKATRV